MSQFIIDTTKKDYYFTSNRFISENITNSLSNNNEVNLGAKFKNMRRQFNIENLNNVSHNNFQTLYFLKDKEIKFNLKEENIDEWKNEFSLIIDDVPYELNGTGTQNMIKSELFVKENDDIDILLVEEPENNLTYTNMCLLVNRLFSNSNKQTFISTHSSYIASKLGLKNLQLINKQSIHTFKDLSDDVNDFFIKLPNFNVLRVILSNHIIFVEGPSDELIIQRAYHDLYGIYPIDDGIDILAVNGISFKNFCALAELIEKEITVVTDNDHDYDKVSKKYKEFKYTKVFTSYDDELNTLEPNLVEANKDNFDEFKKIIYSKDNVGNITEEEVTKYMINNKTEYSLRIYTANEKIKYPSYILNAIDNVKNEGK